MTLHFHEYGQGWLAFDFRRGEQSFRQVASGREGAERAEAATAASASSCPAGQWVARTWKMRSSSAPAGKVRLVPVVLPARLHAPPWEGAE